MLDEIQGLTRRALRELEQGIHSVKAAEPKKTIWNSNKIYREGDHVQVLDERGEWTMATVKCVKGNRIAVQIAGYRTYGRSWLDTSHRSLRAVDNAINISHRKKSILQSALRNGFIMLEFSMKQVKDDYDFEEDMQIWYETHQTSLFTKFRETRLSHGKTIGAPERFDISTFETERSKKRKIDGYFPKKKLRVEPVETTALMKTHKKGDKNNEIIRKDPHRTERALRDDLDEEDENGDSIADERDQDYRDDRYEKLDRDELETYAMANDQILLDIDGVSVHARISKRKGTAILVEYVQGEKTFQKWLDLMDIFAFKLKSDYVDRLQKEGKFVPLKYRFRTREKKYSRDKDGTDSETSSDGELVLPDGVEWMYTFTCNQCGKNIKDMRLYCRYCRNPEDPDDNFDLCLSCFQYEFPQDHDHPKSSFSLEMVDYIYYQQNNKNASKSSQFSLVKDLFLEQTQSASEEDFQSILRAENRTCVLCGDPEDSLHKRFLSEKPLARLTNRKDEKGHFWVHYDCARYSPEVHIDSQGNWYNVASAVRRGRSIVSVVLMMEAADFIVHIGVDRHDKLLEMLHLQKERRNNWLL
jgi:hypothetical protein